MSDSIAFLNPREIAQLLGISYQTAYNWTRAGKFPHATQASFSSANRWQIPLADVEAHIGRPISTFEALSLHRKPGPKPTPRQLVKLRLPDSTLAALFSSAQPRRPIPVIIADLINSHLAKITPKATT